MSSLSFHDAGKGRLHLGLIAGAALLLVPGAAFAGHSASSTRSGGSVSGGGHSSSHSSSSSSSSHSSSHSGGWSSSHSSSSGSHGWSSGSSGERAHAVPRNGQVPGTRQPHDFRGDHHHHGGGGIYLGGPWWYSPWYWDGYGYGYGGGYYGGPWGDGWGWGWGWGPGWWWPGPAYGGAYGGSYDPDFDRGRSYGALDLDVQPEDAEVYVDGHYVGICDDFDGWPQYLWLPEGPHDVVIFADGFQTLTRQIDVAPGRVLEVDDHMARGQSVRPEDLPSAPHARRDDRLQRNREREEMARRRDGSWRDRGTDSRDDEDMTPRERREERNAQREAAVVAGAGQGHVHLRITPGDASVYLDGTFIGTATQVASANGMVVAPGKHRVEVVRPGFQSEGADFDAAPGETVEVKVDLDED